MVLGSPRFVVSHAAKYAQISVTTTARVRSEKRGRFIDDSTKSRSALLRWLPIAAIFGPRPAAKRSFKERSRQVNLLAKGTNPPRPVVWRNESDRECAADQSLRLSARCFAQFQLLLVARARAHGES